jgi:glycosyltransferase involved in cell wall biosynthesis
VSIGLPVYNGAGYLRVAIESLLAQTFTDFELIICDNASTDQTQSICTAFAARDARVKYHRNPRNLGAAGNFNLAFRLARGEYFKWAAHDDTHEPEYLARCVELLDGDPSAVLSHTGARVIDDAAREVALLQGTRPPGMRGRPELYEEDLYDPQRRLDALLPDERLAELLTRTKWCFEVFGLMRADALRRTPLHLSFYGSDKVLLAALALQGPFREAPEPLFVRRFHPGQSSTKDGKAQVVFMSSRGRPQYVPPQVRCLEWYVRLIARSGLPLRDRLRCLRATARWVAWLMKLIVTQRNERGFLHRLAWQLSGW